MKLDWLWRMGIIKTEADETRIRGYQLNYWAGLTVHDAPLECFIPYCKFAFYFTLSDDYFEAADTIDTVRLHRRQIIEIIEGEPAIHSMNNASPLVRGFADIWPQITNNLSGRTKSRFAHFFP